MSKLNWGYISDGSAFESLVQSIVLQKDTTAIIYDRKGPDAGMDAKSEDGQIVYQAKYTSGTNIVSTVKEEIHKIKEYRKSSHKNYQHWKSVKEWHLYTNATINPNTNDQIQQEINKLKDIGIEPKLHHKALIEKYLEKYPDIKESHFDGSNRIFISLSEAINQLKKSPTLSMGLGCKQLIGRDNELEEALEFLSSEKQICVVKGQGGVGKTRFVIELARKANREKNYDIFWANTHTLESSNHWFQLIANSGRDSLIVIDEPDNPQTIKVLIEQSSREEFKNYKFIIISRSIKDHVFLPLARVTYKEIEIEKLDQKSTYEFIDEIKSTDDILSKFDLKKEDIYEATSGLPIWITIILYLIKKNNGKLFIKDISSEKIAHEYFNEIIKGKEEFKKYIQAIAIIKSIKIDEILDRERYEDIEPLIEDFSAETLCDTIDYLIEKKFIVRRGRLGEIKPDVMRDHIIFDQIKKYSLGIWLERVLRIKDLKVQETALIQLARLAYQKENKLENTETPFNKIWDIFFNRVENTNSKLEYKVYELHSILKSVNSVSFQNPKRCLDLVRFVKSKLEGASLISIHVQLRECLYRVSKYEVRLASECFELFLQLYEEEKRINGTESLSIWGQTAPNYISRLIKYSHPLHFEYQKIIFNWINSELDKVKKESNSIDNLVVQLIKEYFDIERNYEHFKGNQIFFSNMAIKPKSPEQKYRKAIYDKIWSILDEVSINTKLKKCFWDLIEVYHKQTNRASDLKGKGSIDSNYWEEELENNFKKIIKHLTNKEIHLSEIQSIRCIWDWSFKYDKRKKFKDYAIDCENLLQKRSPQYEDIKSLLNAYHRPSKIQENISAYIDKHPDLDISELISNCSDYGKSVSDEIFYQLLAFCLFEDPKTKKKAIEYANSRFTTSSLNEYFLVACTIIFHYLTKLVKTENYLESFNFYWKKLTDLKQKEFFLRIMIGISDSSIDSKKAFILEKNMEFISSIIKNECKEQYLRCMILFLAQNLFSHYNRSKKLIEEIFEKTSLDFTMNLYKSFVDHSMLESYSNIRSSNNDIKQKIFMFIIHLSKNVQTTESIVYFDRIWNSLKLIKDNVKGKFSIVDFVSVLDFCLKEQESSLTNIYLNKEFFQLVDPIAETDVQNEEIKNSVKYLLNLNSKKGFVRYYLPQFAPVVDPSGLIIPLMIAEKIKNKELFNKNNEFPGELTWSDYAGYYPINSTPWRVIAKEACKSAREKSSSHKEQIFNSLLKPTYSFVTTVGEVAPYFINQLEDAEKDLKKEKDDQLKEFMEWRLSLAKNQLQKEENRVAEENE